MKITRFCPAKVNLFLEVTGQLPNGYHELATLFAKINIGGRSRTCRKNRNFPHLNRPRRLAAARGRKQPGLAGGASLFDALPFKRQNQNDAG